MIRGALALLAVALVSPAAHAAGETYVVVRPSPQTAAARQAEQPTLETLLENYVEGTITASGMIVSTPPSQNLLIARINAEGSIETSCVVTRGAARTILAKIAADRHVAQEK